jgi:hypothetical protein
MDIKPRGVVTFEHVFQLQLNRVKHAVPQSQLQELLLIAIRHSDL